MEVGIVWCMNDWMLVFNISEVLILDRWSNRRYGMDIESEIGRVEEGVKLRLVEVSGVRVRNVDDDDDDDDGGV